MDHNLISLLNIMRALHRTKGQAFIDAAWSLTPESAEWIVSYLSSTDSDRDNWLAQRIQEVRPRGESLTVKIP